MRDRKLEEDNGLGRHSIRWDLSFVIVWCKLDGVTRLMSAGGKGGGLMHVFT